MQLINLPKDGASDSEAVLIEIFKEEGSQVNEGQIICEVETSKAIFSITTEYSGFLYFLYGIGDKIEVGTPLCYISEMEVSSEEQEENKKRLTPKKTTAKIKGRTISLKAQKLIEEHSIEVDSINEEIISEKTIKAFLAKKQAKEIVLDKNFNETDILIYGIGGHAEMCIDIINSNSDYSLIGFVDDNKSSDEFYNLKYWGILDNIDQLIEFGLKNIVIGIGFINNLKAKESVFLNLKSKINIPTIIHRSAIIEPSAKIGAGCQIMAGAIIGSNVSIKNNCIVNSGAIISHNSVINDSSHITPGAVIAGHVSVGKRVTIGMCSSIYIGLTIKDDEIIKNNEAIIHNK